MATAISHIEADKYRRIAKDIKDQILSGSLKPDDSLPSRREATEAYKVSGETVTRAMATLVAEGLIERRVGLTYTVRPRSVAPSMGDRMAALRDTGNILREGESSKIVHAGVEAPPAWVLNRLGFDEGAEVVVRQRVNSQQDKPISTSVSYFSTEVLSEAPVLATTENVKGGAREAAIAALGGQQASTRSDVTSRIATEEEAQLLELEAGTVVTETIRVVFMLDGRIAEVAKKVTDGSRVTSFDEHQMHV